MTTYTRLEHRKIVLCESVGLGNDGDKIDTSTKTLHDFNVERLQAVYYGNKSKIIQYMGRSRW